MGAVAIDRGELRGKLSRIFARVALGVFPDGSAETMHGRRLKSDVAGDAFGLFAWNQQSIRHGAGSRWCIFQLEEFLACFALYDAAEYADAVVDMHDEVSRLESGEPEFFVFVGRSRRRRFESLWLLGDRQRHYAEHGIARKFDADRMFEVDGEHIHDAASGRKFSGRADQADFGVAYIRELAQKRRIRKLFLRLYELGMIPPPRVLAYLFSDFIGVFLAPPNAPVKEIGGDTGDKRRLEDGHYIRGYGVMRCIDSLRV